MKVWELVEGKNYVVVIPSIIFNKTKSKLFTINNGKLCRYNNYYRKVKIDYNVVKDYDFIEIEVDWTKVKKYTKILVKNEIEEGWKVRCFYMYKGGEIYANEDNTTINNTIYSTSYKYARLN